MKTRKSNKQGISLIVLVITIIVMIILAAAVILSLSSNGIIDRANDAVNKTDEKQMQTLAQTLWADAYLDYLEGKIAEEVLIQRVEDGLLDADKEYKSKYDVNISKDKVTLTLKSEGEWITISDGLEFTEILEIGNGINMIQHEPGYSSFSNCTYKMSIKSPAYEGSVILDAFAGDEVTYCIAFFIDENKNVTPFDSIETLEITLSEVEAGMKKGEIWFIASDYVQVITTLGETTDSYKITKLETKINGIKIFEGDVYEKDLGNIKLPVVDISRETFDVTKKYLLITEEGSYGSTFFEGNLLFGYENWTEECAVMVWVMGLPCWAGVLEENMAVLCGEHVVIYELGDDPDTVFEGEYVAKNMEKGLTLIYWGEEEITVSQIPEFEGKEVDDIMLRHYVKIVLDKDVDLVAGFSSFGEFSGEIRVSGNINLEKFFEGIIYCHINGDNYGMSIDLTAFDEVVIPDRLLNYENYGEIATLGSLTIYVTQEVKNNYLEYDVVQVKSE